MRNGGSMDKRVFYNGDIITMENEGEYTEAVYVEDGIIKKCGSFLEIKEMCDGSTERIDLEGRTMLPAFIDAHSHFAMVGQQASECDLSDCKSFDDIIATMKRYIEDNKIPEGEMVSGVNYDHNFLQEGEHPTKDVLDKISVKHMVSVAHTSGHMGSVNSAVLKKLGLNRDSEFGRGGKYCRYIGSGELNGHMEENAFMSVRQLKRQPSYEEMKAFILKGQKEYLKNGITTVQNGGGVPEHTEILTDLAEDNEYTLDIVNYMMIGNTTPEQMKAYGKFLGKYYNRFKVGGYKMFLDGSPQGRTAWLSKPYEGETEYRGYPVLKDEEVYEYSRRAIEEGRQLLTHCNGDEASEQLIREYTRALRDAGDNRNLRPVMIHAQTVRKDQLKKMKEIGMIPSIFIAHTYYWGDIHIKNLGKIRGENISPARTALDMGHIINFHQDSPVIKPNMLETVWCAVNRISRNGSIIGAQERISVYEALRAVTFGGAYEYFEEDTKGTIREGKKADFTVLSMNPLKTDKSAIRDIEVIAVYKEGNMVYRI